jgi:hypothetical protein
LLLAHGAITQKMAGPCQHYLKAAGLSQLLRIYKITNVMDVSTVVKWTRMKKQNISLNTARIQKWMATMMVYLVKGNLVVSLPEKSSNKSFEYAPSGPDALTRAAQFNR